MKMQTKKNRSKCKGKEIIRVAYLLWWGTQACWSSGNVQKFPKAFVCDLEAIRKRYQLSTNKKPRFALIVRREFWRTRKGKTPKLFPDQQLWLLFRKFRQSIDKRLQPKVQYESFLRKMVKEIREQNATEMFVWTSALIRTKIRFYIKWKFWVL